LDFQIWLQKKNGERWVIVDFDGVAAVRKNHSFGTDAAPNKSLTRAEPAGLSSTNLSVMWLTAAASTPPLGVSNADVWMLETKLHYLRNNIEVALKSNRSNLLRRCVLILVLALAISPTVFAQQQTINFDELETTVNAELKATNTPGAAVAVVLGDRVVFAKVLASQISRREHRLLPIRFFGLHRRRRC